jgi:hypothetical protein
MGCIRRIPEDRHPGDLREGLLEQLQVLADNLRAGDEGQSCDIRPRPREAGDEATLDGIEDCHRDDGDRPGRILGRQGRCRGYRNDDVNLQAHQFVHEVGKPLVLPFRISVLDRDVLAFDVTEFAQALAERVRHISIRGPRGASQEPDPVHLPRRLRLGGQRYSEEAEDARDEGSPVHYWMISSARASTDGGIVRPRAFAVL